MSLDDSSASVDGGQLYKSLVDHLASTARTSVIADRIRKWGHSERNTDDAMPFLPHEAERVALFSELSGPQKESLAGLLEEERKGAVHDVAALLEWLTTTQALELRWHGHVVPESPFGTYHFDLLCRLNGDPWPDESQKRSVDDAKP